MVAENWDFERTYEFGSYPYDGEMVLDQLYEETTARKKLDRDRGMGKLSMMLGEDVAEAEAADSVVSYRVVARGVGNEASVAADLKRRGELDGAQYWDGEKWTPFNA